MESSQKKFKLHSPFKPAGDQPEAIEYLTNGLNNNIQNQILMGVTGSGKTFTMANIIANLNRPTLILAHNKTLAAQLCNEFKEFFPENAVEFFISYYDYYQPEAYIPSRDVYIEKEADINEEIERFRHSATRSLFLRKDVIIVASVSCIYGLGIPEDYAKGVITLKKGNLIPRKKLLYKLNTIQYERNDIELKSGRYRIKGDTIDISPSWDETLCRLHFFGDELEEITRLHPVSGEEIEKVDSIDIFPATHYVLHEQKQTALNNIKQELDEHLHQLKKQGKELEAQRILARTNYDLDMIQEVGYCKGIENYSRHLSGRKPREPGGVLLDFFPDDFITFVDESHVTLPQVRGMFGGDQSRKEALIQYGFRLPSAKDNRPLNFTEFQERVGQSIYVSATPGPYELTTCHKKNVQASIENPWEQYYLAEQLIRPTGLLDPEVEMHPTKNQMDHLLSEIQIRIKQDERVLITALTKKFSEDLCDFLQKKGIKVQYLHSEIHSLDRLDILHDLRAKKYDVLIGVNLLREGLDLPEVSLVAILDADKEGFLRNTRSLIQIMGRAARNSNGKVILYADKLTDSIKTAVGETNRRRSIQIEYNKKHNITPKTIIKKISDIQSETREKVDQTQKKVNKLKKGTSPKEVNKLIQKLDKDMKEAAKNLEFELAAVLRDQIEDLKNLPLF